MKAEIIEALEGLASYYRIDLSPIQLAMYAEDLSCLTREELVNACREYRRRPSSKFFPLPAQLIAIVRPQESDLDIGQDTAARIIGAVSRFGSYRGDEARAWIGELGWECVKILGGWSNFCAQLTDENKTTTFAQVRGLAQSKAKGAMAETFRNGGDFRAVIGDSNEGKPPSLAAYLEKSVRTI